MREFNKAWLVLVVSMFLLGGCKDSVSEPEIDNSVIPAELRGVWKLNSSTGNDIYIEVKADGVDEFDYLGDEKTKGPDCYDVKIGQTILDYRRGDDYIFFFYQAEQTSKYTVNMVLVGDNLQAVTKYINSSTLTYSKISQTTDTFVPHCQQ